MAIEAGRVGVRADQVDPYGRIKDGGGGTGPAVEKLEEQVGSYSFRTNPEDGSAQYRQSDEDEWVNFNVGGGGLIDLSNLTPATTSRPWGIVTILNNSSSSDGIVEIYADETFSDKLAELPYNTPIGTYFFIPISNSAEGSTFYLRAKKDSSTFTFRVQSGSTIYCNSSGNNGVQPNASRGFAITFSIS